MNIRLSDSDLAQILEALEFQAEEYRGAAAYAESPEEEEELRTDSARLLALRSRLQQPEPADAVQAVAEAFRRDCPPESGADTDQFRDWFHDLGECVECSLDLG